MITVEMMIYRLENGDDLISAATYAYKHTAFPMLTGTLVTVAGFIPIGFNSSSAGEYTHSLFVVIAASLLISWVVAVLFAPLLGVKILPKKLKHAAGGPGRLMRMFSTMLLGAMRWRWTTVIVSFALLAASVYGLRFVQQQFFPSSDRVELLVDMTLAGERLDQRDAGSDGPVREDQAGKRGRDRQPGVPTWARAPFASSCRSTSNCRTAFSARWYW